MYLRLAIFLIINFAALGIGGLATGPGVESDWYQNLNQAPWTPPGWVFGAAWTTIMILFAFYMAYAWQAVADKVRLIGLFSLQWFLNVVWNPIFFTYHWVPLALVVISLLTLVVAYFFLAYIRAIKAKVVLVLPYLLWLLIATSLNAYILINN